MINVHAVLFQTIKVIVDNQEFWLKWKKYIYFWFSHKKAIVRLQNTWKIRCTVLLFYHFLKLDWYPFALFLFSWRTDKNDIKIIYFEVFVLIFISRTFWKTQHGGCQMEWFSVASAETYASHLRYWTGSVWTRCTTSLWLMVELKMVRCCFFVSLLLFIFISK